MVSLPVVNLSWGRLLKRTCRLPKRDVTKVQTKLRPDCSTHTATHHQPIYDSESGMKRKQTTASPSPRPAKKQKLHRDLDTWSLSSVRVNAFCRGSGGEHSLILWQMHEY